MSETVPMDKKLVKDVPNGERIEFELYGCSVLVAIWEANENGESPCVAAHVSGTTLALQGNPDAPEGPAADAELFVQEIEMELRDKEGQAAHAFLIVGKNFQGEIQPGNQRLRDMVQSILHMDVTELSYTIKHDTTPTKVECTPNAGANAIIIA